MGGRTKYIVNGHNAQQQTVQNLFQSVQLNINNPHFLIMQGKITKVLNMKPTEILSMVEEAAGTKMFEDRKNKAIITMGKKERKVEEINTVRLSLSLFTQIVEKKMYEMISKIAGGGLFQILQEEIAPKLETLRAEKRVYLDFQKTESEMERLNRVMVAYEYNRHEERLNKSGVTSRQERVNQLTKEKKELENELQAIEEDRNAAASKLAKVKVIKLIKKMK